MDHQKALYVALIGGFLSLFGFMLYRVDQLGTNQQVTLYIVKQVQDNQTDLIVQLRSLNTDVHINRSAIDQLQYKEAERRERELKSIP